MMSYKRIAVLRIGGAVIVAVVLTIISRQCADPAANQNPPAQKELVPSAAGLPASPDQSSALISPAASAPAATSAAQSSASQLPTFASSASRNDSTFDRMLAAAQVNPGSPRAAADITKLHEAFVLTPDDPAWTRPTEQALQNFFQAKTAGTTVEITSVSCRATRCEVRGQHRLPSFDGAAVVAPVADWEGEQRRISDVLHESRPAGTAVVNQENLISQVVGDQMGFLISYTREDTQL